MVVHQLVFSIRCDCYEMSAWKKFSSCSMLLSTNLSIDCDAYQPAIPAIQFFTIEIFLWCTCLHCTDVTLSFTWTIAEGNFGSSNI